MNWRINLSVKKYKYFLMPTVVGLFLFLGYHYINSAPSTPTNSSPSNGSSDVATLPTLSSSAFVSNNDHHSNVGGILDYVGSNHLTGLNLESTDIGSTVSGGVSVKSLSLDGVNESAEVTSPSFSSSTNNQSISLWVRPKSVFGADGNLTFFSIGGADVTNFGIFAIRIRRRDASFAGVTKFEFSTTREGTTTNNSALGSTNVSAGSWYHVVVTTDGSTIKMYVNGNLETLTYYSGSNTGDWIGDINFTAPIKMAVGANYRDGVYAVYSDVYIDEISYWNTLLDASDVTNLYNSGLPNNPRNHADSASLVSYWPIETTTHLASQWQVSEISGDYSSPTFDSGVDTSNLTSITISPALAEGTTYYWQVRYKDSAGNWSNYSTETSFTTVSGGLINYSSGTFSENLLNDGTISNSITATISNETFVNSGGTLNGGGTHYTISNLPAGLTESITVNGDGTIATISLIGNASSHLNSNDISNLSIVFENAAFTGGDSSDVSGSSKTDYIVDFVDPDSSLFASRVISDEPFAYFDFEESSDPLIDIVGSNNGTSVNTPTRRVLSSVGYGYTFDGASQEYISLNNNIFDSLEEGAVEIVFKLDSTSGTQTLFASSEDTVGSNRFSISIASGKVRFLLVNGSATDIVRVSGNTTLLPDVWYHLVVEMDATNGLKIYLNGAEDTPYSFASGSTSNREWFYDTSSGTTKNRIAILDTTSILNPFYGKIDELAIYDSSKSLQTWQEHADLAVSDGNIVVTQTNPGNISIAEARNSFDFNVSLSGTPDEEVTVDFSSLNSLINFSPSSVVFTTGDEDYDITVSSDDNGVSEGVRDVTINLSSSSADNDFDGLENSFDITLTDAFVVWGIGDPHVNTDIESGSYSSLQTAGLDSLGLTSAGHGFNWDIGIIAGDFTGTHHCANAVEYVELVNQFSNIPVDRENFYSIIGNHDSGDNGDTAYFQRYVDPLGENTAYSNVDASNMPYPILPGGEFDHYAFEVGNILFLMLGDRNDADYPFGKTCGSSFVKLDGSNGIDGDYDGSGHPSGTYTEETYAWWVDQIENNPDKIIATVAHHELLNTGLRSGLNEGVTAPNAPHGNHGWADQKGSSIIYTLWDEDANTYSTIDCLDINQSPIPGCDLDNDGYRDYGFKKYLDDNPGSIDMWIYGHTHGDLSPDSTYNGRSTIETVDDVLFLNLLAVTRYHAASVAPFSRVLDFLAGSNELDIRTYRHYTGWSGSVGFYDSAETTFTMSKEFKWPDVTITAVDSNAVEGGGTASYTVVLETQPTYGEDVVITPTSDSEVTVYPLTVSFDSTDWDVPKTVTVTAVDDSEIEGSQNSLITHSISSGDTQYNSLTGLDSVTISIEDNDSGDGPVDEDPVENNNTSHSSRISSVSSNSVKNKKIETTKEVNIPPVYNKNLLKLGNIGIDVKNLQTILLSKKYVLIIDGIFGKNTERIIKLFQKDNGLVSDGVVGPKTWEKILNSSSEIIQNNLNYKTIIKFGDTGESVFKIQKILKEKGLFITEPNGVFGPATEKAVKDFQLKNNLVVDGIVGPLTLKILEVN